MTEVTVSNRRNLNIAAALACAGLMAYALYAQYRLLLEPCPLCVLQRIAVISLGVVFLLAATHNPRGWGRYVYVALLASATAFGAAVAAWHARLQLLPADQVPACGPGLDYMLQNFPIGDVLKMVLGGSGECASVDWQFLGLSMPAWVLIVILLLGCGGIWNNLRRGRAEVLE